LVEPAQPLPAFTLVDQDGSRFDRTHLEGRWSLLFFGFTNCPGPCPAALSMLAIAEKSLADLPAAKRPQVVFISLDPQRDTPTVLKSYVANFNPGFIGVTGNETDLKVLTTALHVPYQIIPMPDGNYMVDHSLAIFAVDPKGGFHALFNASQAPAAISSDYRQLVTRLQLS
jgi:protein SCO1/2